MDVYVSGTTDQKTYAKKFRGGFSPLLDPPMAVLAIIKLQRQSFLAFAAANLLIISSKMI